MPRRGRRQVFPACALLLGFLLFRPLPGGADAIRIATFNTDLTRAGPGLMLRDIAGGKDPQVAAVLDVISTVAPDILALQGVDWDHDGAGLGALVEALAAAGMDYPHRFSARPNSGWATDLDLDGDGRRGGPGDAQGYGDFSGQKAMAVLSRHPIRESELRDFTALLWRDLPGAVLPQHEDGTPFPSAGAQAIQRLSDTAHWVVPIDLPGGRVLSLLTFYATPPVFDGPERRNALRNRDEIALWLRLLDGRLGDVPQNVVLAGAANLDPAASDGHRSAIRALLDHPRLQDPQPRSMGAATDNSAETFATVDWPRVGRRRVDYVLPGREWRVRDAGVFWPAEGEPGHDTALAASRHRLVWVDLEPAPAPAPGDIDAPAPAR